MNCPPLERASVVATDTLTPNSHGRSSVKLISSGHRPTPCFSDPRLSPLYDSARFRCRFKLTYGRRLMAAPLSRLRRARAQEDEAILINGFATPFGVRFARPDLPRLIRSRRLENLVEAFVRRFS